MEQRRPKQDEPHQTERERHRLRLAIIEGQESCMLQIIKIVASIAGVLGIILLSYDYVNRDLFVVILCFTIILPLMFLMIDRMKQKNKLLAMKEEALRAELALLKNQINPHFFFNTLNNLYGLAIVQSEKTPELILRLSDLMRFTIYEGKKDHVLLRDEIAYLQSYLDVQRIRSKLDKVDVKFEIDVNDDLIGVPPLLFIMLVENAIKHGVDSLTANAFIHIALTCDSKTLCFQVRNNFEATPGRRPGIGLANLKRRLELLYPQRHQFRTEIENETYEAEVVLTL